MKTKEVTSDLKQCHRQGKASAYAHGPEILQHNTAKTRQRVRELPFENVSIDHLAQHLSKKKSPNMTVKIEKVRLK